MNGAAPGRETILIFCICCINCGRLYIFSRDGARGHFKKNPEENTNPVVFKKPLTSHSRCGCFYSQTDRRDNSTPVHSTDSPAFNLSVYFFFFFWQEEEMRGQSRCRNVKLSLLCPLTKVLYRLSFFKPLLCLLFICRCCRQTAWNNDTCKVARKK